MLKYSLLSCLLVLSLGACAESKKDKVPDDMEITDTTKTEKATF